MPPIGDCPAVAITSVAVDNNTEANNQPVTITQVAVAAKVATLTANNTFAKGQSVTISGLTHDFLNGTFKVTVNQLATSTRVSSGAPIASVVDANATLGNAGLRYSVSTGTFRINNRAITVDSS